MAYRNDLDALAARHTALAADVADRTRERDAAAQALAEARRRARIDNLKVAAPCSADWSKMTGDDRVRACADCQQHVYNISAMTRDEAEALIVEREGRLCVRYFQRADGTILTRDCAVGVARRRRRRWIIAGASATIVGTILAARGVHDDSEAASFAITTVDQPYFGPVTAHAQETVPEEHRSICHLRPHPYVAPVPVVAPKDEWVMGRK